jgi:broad specificity phosphatase PhoE
MTTRLKLLCHASTSAVRSSAFPADEPLEEQARRKLAALPRRLLGADQCLTSPALRAVQTAEALALAATIAPDLRECDYGRWSGRSLEDVGAQEPEAVAEWLRNLAAAPHGGESVDALIERAAAWLDERQMISGATLAITHASVIRAVVVTAIEARPQSYWRIDIAPLTLVTLSHANGRWALNGIGPAA